MTVAGNTAWIRPSLPQYNRQQRQPPQNWRHVRSEEYANQWKGKCQWLTTLGVLCVREGATHSKCICSLSSSNSTVRLVLFLLIYSWGTWGWGLKASQLRSLILKPIFCICCFRERVVLKTTLSIACKLLTFAHCENISKHSAFLLALGIGYGRKSGPNLDFRAPAYSRRAFLDKRTPVAVPMCNPETLVFNYKTFK